jgi:hypothetical protein
VLRAEVEEHHPILSDHERGYWYARSWAEYDAVLENDKAILNAAARRYARRRRCRNRLWPNRQEAMF